MLDKGEVMTEFSSILDITPTLLELAGTAHPGNKYKERKVHPLNGRSMLSYISGKSKHAYAENEAVSFELFGHACVFMGEWKAVKVRPPQGNNKWALYHIKTDLSETNDLSNKYPNRLQLLTQAHAKYKLENGVLTEPDGITSYPEVPHYVKYKY